MQSVLTQPTLITVAYSLTQTRPMSLALHCGFNSLFAKCLTQKNKLNNSREHVRCPPCSSGKLLSSTCVSIAEEQYHTHSEIKTTLENHTKC